MFDWGRGRKVDGQFGLVEAVMDEGVKAQLDLILVSLKGRLH